MANKVVVSDKNELIWEDVKRVAKNALIFASPLIVLALTELQAGKSWSEISTLVYGAAIQVVIDLFRKWQGEYRYTVEK